MNHWKSLLQASITRAEALSKYLPTDDSDINQVIAAYPMRINPYYLSLIRRKDDPLWKQAVPDIAELRDNDGFDDPLHEEMQSPVPNLIHRYPDRVVMLISGQCAMFCRYCMRKRRVGQPAAITPETIRSGIEYIRNHSQIRDVILSGGDPLLLEDEQIEDILMQIRSISHVEIIRIHSRIPCTLPQRITPELCQILKKFHPLYLNTHFNHPDEITAESSTACAMLSDAGIPLGCQTVLLRGVNDDAVVMKRLMQKLMMIRVKPYYLHQADLVRGTGHFHTHPETGLEIIRKLRGYTSGMCVPQLMIDLPGGGGKIPLVPEYVIEKRQDKWLIRNYENRIFEYDPCRVVSEKSG
jgi:lysine 2,3-aminomutase